MTKFPDGKIYLGDVLDAIKTFSDKSIDSVITSPPYWQLRDYGFSGQWGLEPTFQEYLNHLWGLMDEIWRVLKDEGTVWINLGDSYSTQSGTNMALARGKKYENDTTYLTNRGESELLIKDKSLPNKCLLLIPHRFAIGCIDRGWVLRNDIIWAKRNAMPESVTDRFSKKHEYFFFMVKQQKYYFDLGGVLTPYSAAIDRWGGDNKRRAINEKIDDAGFACANSLARVRDMRPNKNGKNPGDVSDFWDIPTQPSSVKHYATFNTNLIDKPIMAGCPEGGIILDPFMGTATTLIRAMELKRKFVGIDGKKEYFDISKERIENSYQKQKDKAMQGKLF